MIGFGDALRALAPDMLLVLGDRFEIFAAAAAAMVARIPIAHLHGGETTEGAFDESIRHAITKMSHLHFVAAEEYRRRVIQLGEQPERVFLVGGLGIDSIKHAAAARSRVELERDWASVRCAQPAGHVPSGDARERRVRRADAGVARGARRARRRI